MILQVLCSTHASPFLNDCGLLYSPLRIHCRFGGNIQEPDGTWVRGSVGEVFGSPKREDKPNLLRIFPDSTGP